MIDCSALQSLTFLRNKIKKRKHWDSAIPLVKPREGDLQ